MSINHIDVAEERERVEKGVASINQPTFIFNPTVGKTNSKTWVTAVLKQICAFTFILSCLPDIHYFKNLLALPDFPELINAITSIKLTAFYQFSGVAGNRITNPYLDFCKTIPNLQHLTLTFHSAGLASPLWQERERIILENAGMVQRSKELRMKRRAEVITFYGLEDAFELRSLRRLNIQLIDSELVRHFIKQGNVRTSLEALRKYFKDGFRARKMDVEIRAEMVALPYTG